MDLGILWNMVKQIPSGRCTTYGELGRAMPNPVSGLLIGKWMAQCPVDVPWWRVVAKNGVIVTGNRDPLLAHEQRTLLEREGVPFREDCVDLERCAWDPE